MCCCLGGIPQQVYACTHRTHKVHTLKKIPLTGIFSQMWHLNSKSTPSKSSNSTLLKDHHKLVSVSNLLHCEVSLYLVFTIHVAHCLHIEICVDHSSGVILQMRCVLPSRRQGLRLRIRGSSTRISPLPNCPACRGGKISRVSEYVTSTMRTIWTHTTAQQKSAVWSCCQ